MKSIIVEISDAIATWSPFAVFLRLIFSVFAGVVIGIDREMKNRSAGVKTHVLVCLGSALVMVISEYVFHTFSISAGDLNRNGAAVISGVGFLGAGTIITTRKNQIKGLTTAAGLWGCACIGLAAGIGYFWGTMITLILVVFTLKVLSLVDRWLAKYTRVLVVYVEFESNKAIKILLGMLRSHNAQVSDVNLTKSYVKGDGPVATMTVHMTSWKDKGKIVDALQNCTAVSYYEIV